MLVQREESYLTVLGLTMQLNPSTWVAEEVRLPTVPLQIPFHLLLNNQLAG